MPVGKARGSYLRPARTLHFVPVAPSGRRVGGARRGGPIPRSSSRTRRRPTSSSSMRSCLITALPDRERGRSRPRRARRRPRRARRAPSAPITPGADGLRADVRAGRRWRAPSLRRPGTPARASRRTRARPPGSRACARARAGARPRGRAGRRGRGRASVERPLRARVRARRARRRAARRARSASSIRPVVGVHVVHEPPVERRCGRHALAQQRHLERARLAHGRGHEQRRAAVRHQADVHEGEPEVGGLGGQHQVAGERERGADADRRPVHGGHHRLLEAPHAGDDRVVELVQLLADVRHAVVRVRVEARLEVGARREPAAGAGDQHRADATRRRRRPRSPASARGRTRRSRR